MNKILKRTIIAGLCGISALAAASCGGRNPTVHEDWHEDNIDEITLFCNDWEQFNNGAAVETPIYKELVKVTGCDIRARSTGYETYYTQLDLQRNRGELDDMFIVEGPVDPSLFNSLIRDGEILAISDYVNEETKDEYPYLYEYMKKYDYMKSNVSYAEGKTWFIPVQWANEKSLYVRRDWIKNLNNKIDEILVADGVVSSASQITDELRAEYRFSEEGPKTLDEVYRLARAFTIYDPDGNGKDDTRGYVTEANRDMDSWLHVAYDTGWKQYIYNEETKLYESTNTSEGAMLATALLSKMVAEGYISQDVVTKAVGDKQNDFMTGAAGMMYAHNWYNVICAGMMSATPGLTVEGAREKILITDTPAGANGTFGGHGGVEYYRGWCLRGDMSVERREICLKLMEFLHSPEGLELVNYGVYGTNWEWENDDEESGVRVSLIEPDTQGFIQALRWTDPAAFISYLTYTPPESEALQTNGDILVERAKATAASMVLSDYPDVYTDSTIRYLAAAYDYFDETVLKFIRDGAKYAANWTFDAKTWKQDGMEKMYTVSEAMKTAWQEFVNTYNSTYRGKQMQDEYNEFIQSGKAQKRAGLE